MLRIGVFVSTVLLALSALSASAQERTVTIRLDKATLVQPHNVTVKAVRYHDSDVLEIRQIGEARGFDLDTFAFVPGLDFHDGTIELDVAGTRLANAPPGARGFIGVAFRIDTAGATFACEGLYIRPTNGRAEDQVRRNHSTQYFSIRATISIACGGTHRANTNPIRTSCLANGPICGSRSRARPRDSMSALPRSPCSSCRI